LKGSHIPRFPANTDLGATFAFCRLFTLITKHNPPPFAFAFFLDFDPSLRPCFSLRFDLGQETSFFLNPIGMMEWWNIGTEVLSDSAEHIIPTFQLSNIPMVTEVN
jgi:hypothetical protein